MQSHRAFRRFVADASAAVRSDERLVLLFLLLLSVAALAVFLHYTVSLLDGLPEVLPLEMPRPGSSTPSDFPLQTEF
ncbi:hypothetical protein [Halorubrum lacusprofundi]|jgi:hypothetical protein|uniref:Uncharacterized protein n=1 Tax=Halorubrum lacusprofundi (strain ATCC 49239 / DSM 5036 / JCM 8891 / ACAM 34) TaxID=416348 RepID=B9LNA6_HALLT|nr:hypothetical protein [Halorubrum lacusprofundi]ACM56844.1 hypothetical protein Hlac_1252 [Halorubrum lacusprofundi ATCC 49239]MCG1006479.1 hypothetical protein [Halorubrum lacusprofundi]